MELTLLWAALTGVGLAWVGTKLWREDLPERPLDLILGAAAVGLLVGRLVAMTLQGVNPVTNPADIIIVRGGVHTGAASLASLGFLAFTLRRNLGQTDAIAPAALLGLAGWHAGCLWRDACLGTASTLPWAVTAAGSQVSRHPVEIYAALGLAIAAILVSRLPRWLLFRFGLALALAGLVRLATEPLRLSVVDGPAAWYTAAVVVGALLAVATRLRSRAEVTGSDL